MKSYLFKWTKVETPGITGYRIFRVKEDDNLEASKKNLSAAVIGNVATTVNSFTDEGAYDDHTAYHYAVAAIVDGQVSAISSWKRVWRRHEWGPGGDVILYGNEENGYLGHFEGAGDFLPSDTTVPVGTGMLNSYVNVHKFIYKKRIVIIPDNVIGESNNTSVRNYTSGNANLDAIRTRLQADDKAVLDLNNVTFNYQRLVPHTLGLRLAGLSTVADYCYTPYPLGLTKMYAEGWTGAVQFYIGGMHRFDGVEDPNNAYSVYQTTGVNTAAQTADWVATNTGGGWSWCFTGCWAEPALVNATE